MNTVNELSILIPAFNYGCAELVSDLHRQALASGIRFEIIVAEDGTTDEKALVQNAALAQFPQCRYLPRQHNAGRAVIRNWLAQQSRHEWLLFLDCDVRLPDERFLERYLTADDTGNAEVVDGGIAIPDMPTLRKCNLRYLYEKASEPQHNSEARQRNPYRSFRTTNFMVRREVMLTTPFDERFLHYGYEDVLFGKQLKNNRKHILHIDNPVVITDLEGNEAFVAKTEEAMRTLHHFQQELRGYSALLTAVENLRHRGLLPLLRLWHKTAGRAVRRNLTGKHPWLRLFNIYKLGYYLNIK